MSRKSRGISAERDLIHKFWSKAWACMRAAGSGSGQFPSPDIIAGNNLRQLVLEVKITTEKRKYFSEEEIRNLRYFSEKFGAEPWVGVKFYRKPWVFLSIEDLEETGKNYVVSPEIADLKGLSFEELTDDGSNV